MIPFIYYLTEVNVALILCIVAYALFLRNETQFAFNRFFLLGGIGFSLLFPLIPLNSPVIESVVPSMSDILQAHWLPSMSIQERKLAGSSASPGVISISSLLKWTYLLLVMLVSSIFLVRLTLIVRLIIQSKKYPWENCLVAESETDKPTFSFFNFIFIGQAGVLTREEKEKILQHELVHVRKKHSLDILLVNALAILCWFNPIVRLYKNVIIELHEFEADAQTVEPKDVDAYCQLMAKVALQESGFSLANHFIVL